MLNSEEVCIRYAKKKLVGVTLHYNTEENNCKYIPVDNNSIIVAIRDEAGDEMNIVVSKKSRQSLIDLIATLVVAARDGDTHRDYILDWVTDAVRKLEKGRKIREI